MSFHMLKEMLLGSILTFCRGKKKKKRVRTHNSWAQWLQLSASTFSSMAGPAEGSSSSRGSPEDPGMLCRLKLSQI